MLIQMTKKTRKSSRYNSNKDFHSEVRRMRNSSLNSTNTTRAGALRNESKSLQPRHFHSSEKSATFSSLNNQDRIKPRNKSTHSSYSVSLSPRSAHQLLMASFQCSTSSSSILTRINTTRTLRPTNLLASSSAISPSKHKVSCLRINLTLFL